MTKVLLLAVIMTLFIGCGGDGKLKIKGTITKQSLDAQDYFTIKDEKTNKLYRIDKKSEVMIAKMNGHRIKMAVKVLETDSSADGVETVASCTKCHHSIKEI